MTSAEELVAEDGSALVPQHMAAGVFAVLWRHCKVEGDRHGAALSPDMHALLLALHRAASHVPTAPTSSEGSDVGNSEILGAHEVANILGCSRRWATALLGSGRLRSRQLGGRTWVTTRGDLDAYRYGREEAPGGEEHEAEDGEAEGVVSAPSAAEDTSARTA